MRRIDTHVHIADASFRQGDAPITDPAWMLEKMDQYGVEASWISPVGGLYPTGEFFESNRHLYQFCSYAPKRFIGFCVVNPSYGKGPIVDEIKRCVEQYGVRGLKLHPWMQAFPISLPTVNDITEACIRYSLPMLFHDGTPPYATTLAAANLAQRYPEATIILGHSGLIETYGNAIAAARRLPNVWLSLCGPSISQLQKIVDEADHERIMFGTDFGFGTNDSTLRYRTDMWRYVRMDDDTRAKLYFRNADCLIKR